MKMMDASKARKTFARVLEAVRDRRETIVIARYGEPMAALVPIGRLEPNERKDLSEKRRSAVAVRDGR